LQEQTLPFPEPLQRGRLAQCEQEKRELDFILLTAGAGTWKWDTDTDIVEVSGHLRELLGYSGQGRADCSCSAPASTSTRSRWPRRRGCAPTPNCCARAAVCSTSSTNMQKTIAFIERLAARGCRFSLDDFGTGMTSFACLKQLPVDFIKIDGSLIQAMLTSEVDYEMVRFTNDISHRMGRKTIAEYVTDPALAEHLGRIGVDFVQGYFIGEPRPLATAPFQDVKAVS
jgi:hypothetical protein